MTMLALLLAAQSIVQAGQQAPVLQFPEAGLDDPAAYEGYSTRFYRDSRRNAFQVYLNAGSGRVVHVWADATNASAAFTVREATGQPAPLTWGGPGAEAYSDGGRRVMRHRLASAADEVAIGWFALGTMRQERDLQYWEWDRRPYGRGRIVLAELTELVGHLERLPADEQARHVTLLRAGSVAEVRARLDPQVSLSVGGSSWIARIAQPSIDGQNLMTLVLRGDLGATSARLSDNVVSVRSRDGGGVAFDVIATTDGPSLTPLTRDELFNEAFEAFFARERRTADSLRRVLVPPAARRDPSVIRFRRLERDVRGLELLSSREKLMAALPNYATYFGRDMMMSALMLEPIATVDLQEYVITNALRKLNSSGDVSHEEALGGQAIRENAAAYNAHIEQWEDARQRDPGARDEHLAAARELLRDLQVVRENYRMIDDDFQFPILVDRYLARTDVPAERKRRFLSERALGGASRLDALVRNLALVAERARPYAERPEVDNLVRFLFRDDDGWFPGSWRDSRVGYGNAPFAMDVNVVWVPDALGATARILQVLDSLDLSVDDAVAQLPAPTAALNRYLRDPAYIQNDIVTWRGARRHFELRLEPNVLRARVEALLESLPEAERRFWRARVGESNAWGRPLAFLALSLDDDGRPIAAPNTDNATELFLGDYTEEILQGTIEPAAVELLLDALRRPYPVGVAVEGLGPLVVNDAYADGAVQQRFREDLYHSPRVVWGREVNLLLLGLARQIDAAYDDTGQLRSEREKVRAYVAGMRRLLEDTRRAVEASGMRHNELWSYRIENGSLRPVRYGTSSDIQLWNLTDLAVRFVLDRLPPR